MSGRFYILEPEVAGGMGEGTVLDRSTHPPGVSRLHYEFEGWLGDELLTTFPCYIVTARVQDALETLAATGVGFDAVQISASETFRELNPGRKLPEFAWLKVTGTAGKDDLGLSSDHRLVVSQRVLDRLKQFPLQNCEVDEYPT